MTADPNCTSEEGQRPLKATALRLELRGNPNRNHLLQKYVERFTAESTAPERWSLQQKYGPTDLSGTVAGMVTGSPTEVDKRQSLRWDYFDPFCFSPADAYHNNSPSARAVARSLLNELEAQSPAQLYVIMLALSVVENSGLTITLC